MASRTVYSTWTPQNPTLFDAHYLRNRSTLDIGVLGYIGIVQHKEHSLEVSSIPPGTPCIYVVLLLVWIINYKATFKHPVYYRKRGILHSAINFYMKLTLSAKFNRTLLRIFWLQKLIKYFNAEL